MLHHSTTSKLIAAVGAAVLIGSLSACSSGGSTGGGSGSTEISFQTGSDTAAVDTAKALISAFEKQNPKVTVKIDQAPAGADADNLVKTRLSTGEMSDVFAYNSGSLFQALNPDNTLVPLSDQSWVKDLDPGFKSVVSTNNGVYAAPFGSTYAGGVMYNKKVYAKLGLSVPDSWSEFVSNSEKIKAAGITPVEQTYGDTWTSQLTILSDFANVTSQQSDWATQFTKHKESYTEQPAFAGWQHLAELKQQGLLNKDFASATQANGLKALSDGTAAQYPMLSVALDTIKQDAPSAINDIGMFALPAENASDTKLTLWQPSGLFIPKSTTGDKLDAAKKFIAFANSAEGCKVQATTMSVSGPYAISTCTLPSDVPTALKDIQQYITDDKASPALEFLSPIKGPNLEKIAVEVGSGITSAQDGAKQYDSDVVQQAQQLGLEGW